MTIPFRHLWVQHNPAHVVNASCDGFPTASEVRDVSFSATVEGHVGLCLSNNVDVVRFFNDINVRFARSNERRFHLGQETPPWSLPVHFVLMNVFFHQVLLRHPLLALPATLMFILMKELANDALDY